MVVSDGDGNTQGNIYQHLIAIAPCNPLFQAYSVHIMNREKKQWYILKIYHAFIALRLFQGNQYVCVRLHTYVIFITTCSSNCWNEYSFSVFLHLWSLQSTEIKKYVIHIIYEGQWLSSRVRMEDLWAIWTIYHSLDTKDSGGNFIDAGFHVICLVYPIVFVYDLYFWNDHIEIYLRDSNRCLRQTKQTPDLKPFYAPWKYQNLK